MDVGPTHPADTLNQVVAAYVADYREKAKRYLSFFRGQKDLADAVRLAAAAELPSGKRHPHQRQIPRSALSEAGRRLAGLQYSDLETFEELHEAVVAALQDVRGVGELYLYDTAHRIGAYLGLEPEAVYVHSGTRKGAQALGFSGGRKIIAVKELPAAFQELEAHEIEDCLCIYRDEIQRWSVA